MLYPMVTAQCSPGSSMFRHEIPTRWQSNSAGCLYAGWLIYQREAMFAIARAAGTRLDDPRLAQRTSRHCRVWGGGRMPVRTLYRCLCICISLSCGAFVILLQERGTKKGKQSKTMYTCYSQIGMANGDEGKRKQRLEKERRLLNCRSANEGLVLCRYGCVPPSSATKVFL